MGIIKRVKQRLFTDYYKPPEGYKLTKNDSGLYWLKKTTMVKVNGLPILLQSEAIAFSENNIEDGKTIFKIEKC